MPLQRPHAETDSVQVRVVRPMNDHGGMTLEDDGSGAQYHVVEYRTPELRKTLRSLPRGATVPVELTALSARGNAWRALGIGND